MDERRDGLTRPATDTTALLFFVFNLAFALTPYWKTLGSPSRAWLAFAMSVPLGILWSTSAGSAVRLGMPRRLGVYSVVLLVCLAIDWRALAADIPWHGDEDFHVMATAPLAWRMKPYALPGLIAVGLYAVVNLGLSRRMRWVSMLSMVALAALGLAPTGLFDYERFDPLRYPYVSRYLSALPILVSSYVAERTPEAVYRVMPFLAAVATAWLTARRAAGARTAIVVVGAIFVFTVPLVFYYSSILYLELPAAFLMAVVAFRAEAVLGDDVPDVMREPAWLALVLIGFVKETALPFLAAVLACRLIVQAGRWRRAPLRPAALLGELRVAFAVLTPLLLYLWYRSQRANTRAPSMAIRNALDGEVWSAFGRSYLEQFGPLLFLGLAGVGVLLAARRYRTVLLLVTAYACDTALHVVDYKDYAGYSRFNLFVLPLALVAAAAAIAWACERTPRAAAAGLACGVVVNVLMSPVNADGSKQPLWGNRLIDTSEHYYPYKRAERWIRDRGLSDARIRFTGMPDPYYAIGFVRPFPNQDERLVARDGDEALTLEHALADAAADARDVVVYHVVGPTVPVVTRTAGFSTGEVLANQAHALVVFRRAQP